MQFDVICQIFIGHRDWFNFSHIYFKCWILWVFLFQKTEPSFGCTKIFYYFEWKKNIFGMNMKLVQGLLLYLGKKLHEENDHCMSKYRNSSETLLCHNFESRWFLIKWKITTELHRVVAQDMRNFNAKAKLSLMGKNLFILQFFY